MAELGMAGGVFEVALEAAAKAARRMPLGSERVEFLVSANPGQPPRALRKVASGGELSRISLAIEVAALGLDAVPTMVFDEVDTGIGGAVAEVVGQKLRALGATRQVLCVTHLPQVAAQGHHHFQVSKAVDGGSTQSAVHGARRQGRASRNSRACSAASRSREARARARDAATERDALCASARCSLEHGRPQARRLLSGYFFGPHVQHQAVLFDHVAVLVGDLLLQALRSRRW